MTRRNLSKENSITTNQDIPAAEAGDFYGGLFGEEEGDGEGGQPNPEFWIRNAESMSTETRKASFEFCDQEQSAARGGCGEDYHTPVTSNGESIDYDGYSNDVQERNESEPKFAFQSGENGSEATGNQFNYDKRADDDETQSPDRLDEDPLDHTLDNDGIHRTTFRPHERKGYLSKVKDSTIAYESAMKKWWHMERLNRGVDEDNRAGDNALDKGFKVDKNTRKKKHVADAITSHLPLAEYERNRVITIAQEFDFRVVASYGTTYFGIILVAAWLNHNTVDDAIDGEILNSDVAQAIMDTEGCDKQDDSKPDPLYRPERPLTEALRVAFEKLDEFIETA